MKKALILLLSALVLLSTAGCGLDGSKTPAVSEPPATEPSSAPGEADTVGDYYPIQENVLYCYDGEGSEYAGYKTYIDYTNENSLQLRDLNGGTVITRVVRVAEDKVMLLYSREESYYRENALDLGAEESGEILLMAPIRQGASWTQPEGSVSTITDIAAQVETPAGSYEAVCVETQNGDFKTLRYFAKGIGLVKTVFRSGDMEVYSALTEISKDVPFTQTVRFYYPDAQSGRMYYRDSELSFRTNDDTAKKLTAAYKEDFSGRPGTVLTKNTVINSLYRDAEGILHIDLNAAFVAEMDGGSSYETLVLQSLANTFGTYYEVQKVIPTIDGALYESRHMVFEQGAYLTVNTANVLPVGAQPPSTAPSENPEEPTESPVPPTESPTEPTESPIPPTESPTDPTESPAPPTVEPTEPVDSRTA
jgi:hypothetical protein